MRKKYKFMLEYSIGESMKSPLKVRNDHRHLDSNLDYIKGRLGLEEVKISRESFIGFYKLKPELYYSERILKISLQSLISWENLDKLAKRTLKNVKKYDQMYQHVIHLDLTEKQLKVLRSRK